MALFALGACHAATPDAAPDAAASSDAPTALAIRVTTGPIQIDGEWREQDWNDRTAPVAFLADSGEQARPYSELRLLHDATTLYVGLYAADEDIESTDFFQVTIGTLDLRVHPDGHVSASEPGIIGASDVDGTPDQPGDFDEEWVVELAIPRTLVALGATPLEVHASRCDITKDQLLRCGAASPSVIIDDATTP